MGVAQRKERHKEELKKIILDAAKALFIERGFEATSIRNIAEKIEYSPATIYLYYKDKDEVMHALHQEAFLVLMNYFKILSHVSHPFERLKAMGKAYIQFARENPDYYKLIFIMEEPMKHVGAMCQDEWDEGDRAFNVLLNTVSECIESGYFKDFQAHCLSMTIWSTVHGICTLLITSHLEHVRETQQIAPDVDTIVDFTFETFIKMLEKLKD